MCRRRAVPMFGGKCFATFAAPSRRYHIRNTLPNARRFVSSIFVDCFVVASVKLSTRLRNVRRFVLRTQKGISIWCRFYCDVRTQDATMCFITLPCGGSSFALLFCRWMCDVCDRFIYFSWSNSIANWPRGKHFSASTHFACVSHIMS